MAAVIDTIKQHTKREGESKILRNNLLLECVGKQYQIDWIVRLKTSKASVEEILADGLAPKVRNPYPDNPLATAISVIPRQTTNPRYWMITVTYDTERLVQLFTDNPLNQPPEVFYGTYKYNAPMVYDELGVPCLTSAGNRFDPIPTKEWERTLVTIIRNTPEFPMAQKRRFNFRLNKLPFMGWKPFQGRINDMTGRRMLSNGRIFWQETHELEFRNPPDSFFDFYLDADYRDKTGFIFQDPVTLTPYSTPTLLNGRGWDIATTVHTLVDNIGGLDKEYDISGRVPDLIPLYPPPPADVLPNGMRPGPYNTEFMIEVRSIADSTKFEIMKVVGGIDSGVWKLERGFFGGTQSNWVAGTARVKLLAYYMKYTPYLAVDWTPLNYGALGLP